MVLSLYCHVNHACDVPVQLFASAPSGTPTLSANNGVGAILWVASGPLNGATLRAYDASLPGDISTAPGLLFQDSWVTPDRIKFVIPVVANGFVYIGGRDGVSVYGLK
jgi:hypothetical protein